MSFRPKKPSTGARPAGRPSYKKRLRFTLPPGLYYDRGFISKEDRLQILDWLATIYPIWEERFSANNPPPPGQTQRRLLRPVYWLGNWQFACLNYYHPPKGIENRCVRAEPFPPVLARLVSKIQDITRSMYRGPDLPRDWQLNTCLVNYYGCRIESGGKRIDTARVGEHKDFEPGPVASLSLGERALFQFVQSHRVGSREGVVFQQWLDDGSLQIFGGRRWKQQYFHRVQRVDDRDGFQFPIHVSDFEPRRINFTFRFVPEHHIKRYSELPAAQGQDVRGYMQELARHSGFFRRELDY